MLRFTTETGRVYDVDLDGGFWLRRAKPGGYQGGWERTWSIQARPDNGPVRWPWDDETWEARLPVVGENLFVSSRDVWYASTPITSIEELPSPFDDQE